MPPIRLILEDQDVKSQQIKQGSIKHQPQQQAFLSLESSSVTLLNFIKVPSCLCDSNIHLLYHRESLIMTTLYLSLSFSHSHFQTLSLTHCHTNIHTHSNNLTVTCLKKTPIYSNHIFIIQAHFYHTTTFLSYKHIFIIQTHHFTPNQSNLNRLQGALLSQMFSVIFLSP